MSLAHKTLSGFVWTLFSRMGTRFSIFVVGIILARLLTPADFGLVAMLGVFFAISNSLVDSGFTQALIREKYISQDDKNTVFSVNMIMSILMYSLLWFGSPYIAAFFNQPPLLWLTRVMGLDILFKAVSIVQRAVLMNTLKFKFLSAVDVSVSILTGVISIILAYKGLGVWALAIKYFLSSLFVSIIFYVANPWKPTGFINKHSFRRMFAFGSNMMITGLVNNIFNNVYNLVIGKYFSAATLGFYNRAFNFTNQFSGMILTALGQVTYPVLSKTKDDIPRLKSAIKRILMSVSFVNIPLAVFLFVAAEPFIRVLLGQNWIETVPYLRILSIAMLVSYMINLNHNVLKVVGRSDLFLYLSIINKVLTVFVVIVSFKYGVLWMVTGSTIVVIIEVILSMVIISKFIKYRFKEQIRDIYPNLLITLPMIVVFVLIITLNLKSEILELSMMVVLGLLVYFLTAKLFNIVSYIQIKELVIPYIQKFRNKK